MNKFKLLVVVCLLCCSGLANAQSTEIQQLLLNVEKLSQLKSILSDMKKGYTILSIGYNSVKNIAQGNFNLHEVFLDGLMLVSPEVKKYHKVADIITYQGNIVSEYKSAYKRFSGNGTFSVTELDYVGKVYKKLFDESVQNLDRLLMVITTNKLRMSDDERLQAIDRIYDDTIDKLTFLRSFNRETGMLSIQRTREKADLQGVGNYFNIN